MLHSPGEEEGPPLCHTKVARSSLPSRLPAARLFPLQKEGKNFAFGALNSRNVCARDVVCFCTSTPIPARPSLLSGSGIVDCPGLMDPVVFILLALHLVGATGSWQRQGDGAALRPPKDAGCPSVTYVYVYPFSRRERVLRTFCWPAEPPLREGDCMAPPERMHVNAAAVCLPAAWRAG